MPAKTIAEAEAVLNSRLDLFAARVDTLRRDCDQTWKAVEEYRKQLDDLRTENAVLRQRLDDHLKRYEQWEARRWGLVMALVGAALSLAAGLIVTLARTTAK